MVAISNAIIKKHINSLKKMKRLLLSSELKNDNILRVEINGSLERSFATVYEMRIYNSAARGSLDIRWLC